MLDVVVDLSKPERTQLSRILGCDDADLDFRLKSFSAAATEEYLRMVLGQRVFTRGTDVREYRLYLLIVHVFGGRLPNEQQISDLFQTTTTQSRALLRAVMSKYQYELQAVIDRTLSDVLKAAKFDEKAETWSITIDSENVVEALNRRLASIDGTLPQVTKARNTITTYEIPNSSYDALNSTRV